MHKSQARLNIKGSIKQSSKSFHCCETYTGNYKVQYLSTTHINPPPQTPTKQQQYTQKTTTHKNNNNDHDLEIKIDTRVLSQNKI